MTSFIKILKVSGAVLLGMILIVIISGVIISKPLPEGVQGQEADELAQQLLSKVNSEAFEKTALIEWTFAGIHSYKWYKSKHYVIVSTDSYKVKLDLKEYSNSIVLSSANADHKKLIEKSITNFNNDSFWLVAPYKLMDEGTERRLVTKNGKQSLLVTYTKGGSTPGDSYLWNIDKNNKPTSFEMWVSILPIGGLEAIWKEWTTTETEMLVSTKKTIFGIPIAITDLKTSF